MSRMLTDATLEEALGALGALLESAGEKHDLVLIGGGALLLAGYVLRPTEDLDALARVASGRWQSAHPLPPGLVEAIDDVARAYDLPDSKTGKAWLNSGPTFLLQTGLPDGMRDRVDVRVYRGLTIRLASRLDQIHLKLYAATSPDRGRRAVDLEDLVALHPTREELGAAVAWCARLDGRLEFVDLDVRPALAQAGLEDLLGDG